MKRTNINIEQWATYASISACQRVKTEQDRREHDKDAGQDMRGDGPADRFGPEGDPAPAQPGSGAAGSQQQAGQVDPAVEGQLG
jgi:hypothetical protein